MSVSLTAVRRAIYGLLQGGLSGGRLTDPFDGSTMDVSIYYDQAPETARYPFVLFSKSSGSTTGTFRGFAKAGKSVPGNQEDLWQVKAVDQADSADRAELIADRINYLLDGKPSSLSISGGTSINFVRESDVNYPEPDGGLIYYHVGALFRLSVDET